MNYLFIWWAKVVKNYTLPDIYNFSSKAAVLLSNHNYLLDVNLVLKYF